MNTKEKNSVTPELTTIAYFYALIHLNASDWFVIKLQLKELKEQLLNFCFYFHRHRKWLDEKTRVRLRPRGWDHIGTRRTKGVHEKTNDDDGVEGGGEGPDS